MLKFAPVFVSTAGRYYYEYLIKLAHAFILYHEGYESMKVVFNFTECYIRHVINSYRPTVPLWLDLYRRGIVEFLFGYLFIFTLNFTRMFLRGFSDDETIMNAD